MKAIIATSFVWSSGGRVFEQFPSKGTRRRACRPYRPGSRFEECGISNGNRNSSHISSFLLLPHRRPQQKSSIFVPRGHKQYFIMEKVEQLVKKADEYLAKYPSVTQFGRSKSQRSFSDGYDSSSTRAVRTQATWSFVRYLGCTVWSTF